MVDFEYYHDTFSGKLERFEFEELEPDVCRLINAYIQNNIPYWKIRKLSEYGIDFSEVICMQIDFIAENGGKAALQGNSDFIKRKESRFLCLKIFLYHLLWLQSCAIYCDNQDC